MTPLTPNRRVPFSPEALIAACAPLVPAERFSQDAGNLERLSKDFYWYSPVLKPQLDDKRAEISFTPKSLDELECVIAQAVVAEIPIVLRGAGTGNYGQLIPLYGGLVIDLGSLDQIYRIDAEGYAVTGPGARLGKIEEQARDVGWELRCYPSTWVKASVGGFLGGGSGGIGSISHGALRENGTVRGVEIMTIEEKPQRIWIRGEDVLAFLHGYGTSCILITIELALARKVEWGQIAAAFTDFSTCLDFTESIALDESIQKRLVTCFEWPIPSYFKPLKSIIAAEKAMTFLEVRQDQLPAIKARVETWGGTVTFEQGYNEPRKGPLLSDYTWNHTTLWAIKADETWTYLQCGMNPETFRDQIKLLKEKYADDFLLHLEFIKSRGVVIPASLPLIRYTTDARVQEMIDYCETIGVGVSNPHTYLVNAGKPIPLTDKKYELKRKFDPKSLLNPGKLPNAPLPAALTPAM